jgi:hypothetical protein
MEAIINCHNLVHVGVLSALRAVNVIYAESAEVRSVAADPIRRWSRTETLSGEPGCWSPRAAARPGR